MQILASSKGLQRQGVYGLSRTRVKFCVKLLIANPFTPDFLKWTSISEFGWVHYIKNGCRVDKAKLYSDKIEKANSVDPDETTSPGPTLYAKHFFWSVEQKGLRTDFLMKWFILALKMPRKPVSESVVWLCSLLNILANFSNLFLNTGKQCGPWSDCS